MSSYRVPEELLSFVRADLTPVQPLRSPWRRALAVVPFGLLLVVGVPALWGFRSNLSELRPWLSWGLSALEAAAGFVAVALALREATPGRTLPPAAVGAIVVTALGLVLGVTLATERAVPTVVPTGVWGRYAWECFLMAAGPGLAAVALAARLAARGLSDRPALTGALYGLGAGLMADAGARLFCWVSAHAHVFVAHGGAILSLVAAGAALSTAREDLRARRHRRTPTVPSGSMR